MITPAPETDKWIRPVISFRSDILYIVQPIEYGRYACDTNCPQWLCAHNVAVAEVNSSLKSILEWYVAYAP